MKHLRTLGIVKVSAILAIVFIAGLMIMWPMVREAKAATSSSGPFYVHNTGGAFSDIDLAYAIITDIDTGDIMNSSTGVADATWANCDILFTQDVLNTAWAGCTLPALNTHKRYAIVIYEDGAEGTPVVSDTIAFEATRFDPVHKVTFTDTNPLFRNEVMVR